MSDSLPSANERLVIEGVPKVAFYDGSKHCPEDLTLPACLHALLEFLGDATYGCKHCSGVRPGCKVLCTYAFLVGVTGAGAYLSWKDGWADDNLAMFYMSADPAAPEQHALDALGYRFDWVEERAGQDGEQGRLLAEIVASLRRGMPVLSYGVIGPPETGIITGIDEGGDVLIGWNFFQHDPGFAAGVEYEPSGYYRKRHWLDDTHSLLILDERVAAPPLRVVYRDALAWSVSVTRTPMVRPEPDAPEWYRGRHNGLAAYSAWAEHLLCDADFPAGEEAVLRQRGQVHDAAVFMVATARWYQSQFLAEAADDDHTHYRLSEDLLHAAALYAGEHELMWQLWELAGGNGNPSAYEKLASPTVRRQMVPIILQAREKDAAAIAHIERALEDWPLPA